ncbi:TAXI family TRAP transporter solute-binding subunit [bacterium]|nr:TAXI family TRAP transporter solute-binding subunit [bacterium]
MRMFIAASLLLWPTLAMASTDMVMLTGPETGTYVRIGKDVAKAVAKDGVTVQVESTGGSVENVNRIAHAEDSTVGIVQSDVLGFLKRSGTAETKATANKIRLLYPLYNEEVHLLARRDIADVQGLNGKRVAVGAEGSGHWLTAMNVMSILGIKPSEIMRLSPPQAAAAVLEGKADAMFFVGGKPVKLFKNMESLSKEPSPAYKQLLGQVHFLALEDPKLMREYKASVISSADYLFSDTRVPTIAVTSVLMVHGSDDKDLSASERRQRCEDVHELGAAIKSSFSDLQSNGHPKWNEVNLSAPMPLWQRDKCVDGKPSMANAENAVGKLESDLLKSLEKNKKK